MHFCLLRLMSFDFRLTAPKWIGPFWEPGPISSFPERNRNEDVIFLLRIWGKWLSAGEPGLLKEKHQSAFDLLLALKRFCLIEGSRKSKVLLPQLFNLQVSIVALIIIHWNVWPFWAMLITSYHTFIPLVVSLGQQGLNLTHLLSTDA